MLGIKEIFLGEYERESITHFSSIPLLHYLLLKLNVIQCAAFLAHLNLRQRYDEHGVKAESARKNYTLTDRLESGLPRGRGFARKQRLLYLGGLAGRKICLL